jgi:hypothetical protein
MAKGKMIEEISEDKGVPIPKIRNILKDSGFNGGLINNLNDDQISELFTQYNERVTKT